MLVNVSINSRDLNSKFATRKLTCVIKFDILFAFTRIRFGFDNSCESKKSNGKSGGFRQFRFVNLDGLCN